MNLLHPAKTLVLVVFFAVALLQSVGLCQSEAAIPFSFDGSTVLRWDRIDPHSSHNLFGIMEGDHCDLFPISRLSTFGLSIWDVLPEDTRLTAAGAAGSEFGDPLLNKLDDPSLANRDHYTLLESSVKIPGLPLRLFNGYRYVDHYSDRFDTLWAEYRKKNGKEMLYANRGVAHGISGGYSLKTKRLKLTGFADNYGYWGATPYFFSPIYRKGMAYTQAIETSIGEGIYAGSIRFDQYERYYDHHTPEAHEDWIVSGRVKRSLNGTIFGTLEYDYDSRITPRSRLAASLRDSLPRLNWLMHTAVYDNGQPELTASAKWHLSQRLFLAGKGAWDYFPNERPFTFHEMDKPVHYRSNDFRRQLGIFQTGYQSATRIPFEITGWYRYADTEAWESVESFPDSTVITRDTVADISRHFCGALFETRVKRGSFAAVIHADGGVALQDPPSRFNLPWRSFVELSYGKPDTNWFYAAVRYEIRSRGALNFYDRTQEQVVGMHSPSQNDLSFRVMVPFLMPFGREHLRSRVWISAQSIRLFSNQRLQSHPAGNLIGPRVSLVFDGMIR